MAICQATNTVAIWGDEECTSDISFLVSPLSLSRRALLASAGAGQSYWELRPLGAALHGCPKLLERHPSFFSLRRKILRLGDILLPEVPHRMERQLPQG